MDTELIAVKVYDIECVGQKGLAIEQELMELEGVVNAYTNPAIQYVYVEQSAGL